ncbi:MAG: prepilin-type N-terminal cleavage/methylation domain-containing protein [Candidatus Kerfeldbacteria bacterium]|nr:prepilin-type N-terminal cleavage/methylation domain-containing protein [Candidatus Kerfeldbacteria bacterium]
MNSSGFTIVEVLVTAAIIAILATITSLQTGRRDPGGYVHESKELLRSTTELARTYAMTGHLCCNNSYPPDGYGVFWTMDGAPDQSYMLYADLDNNQRYDSDGVDQVITNHSLDDVVNFTSCSDGATTITPNASPPNTCDIHFSFGQENQAYHVYWNGIGTGIATLEATVQHQSATTETDTMTVFTKTFLIE